MPAKSAVRGSVVVEVPGWVRCHPSGRIDCGPTPAAAHADGSAGASDSESAAATSQQKGAAAAAAGGGLVLAPGEHALFVRGAIFFRGSGGEYPVVPCAWDTVAAQVLSPRTLSLFYIENTSVHRKGV